jgi:tRNA dimethylallyltransferase
MPKPLLVAVCGPTAVGKTALGISIAQKYNGEAISADSRQFFRELTIGTAKPTDREMAGIPHHFINNLSISDDYSAGRFENEAVDSIDDIINRKKLPVLVGGSGLYLKAVLEGIDPLPADEAVKAELEGLRDTKGLEALQAELKEKDPEHYRRIDLKNPRRVVRALEIVRLTGATMEEMQKGKAKARSFTPLIIGVNMDREKLYDRINMRVDNMMNDGLEKEVKALLPFREKQAMQTVGYRELVTFFEGQISRERAIELIKRNTRRYAKRQLTWLRKMKNIHWFEPSQEEKALELIAGHLKQR